jgi:hypothetical protein
MSELPDLDVLVHTRESLHRVAEHVLAAARMRTIGEFGLLPRPGGFGTPPFRDDRVIAVEGTDLVVTGGGASERAPLTTVRAAADLVGTEPGFPAAGETATTLEPDAPLAVDPAAARVIADWFALGEQALRRLSIEVAAEAPSEVVLFPEHFDLGVTAGGVNYGASPGDGDIPLPYVYVGPHAEPPAGDFWNAPFGAYRSVEQIGTVDEAVAFFLEGHARLTT